ncbi:unnamed protein product [Meganyctiphanes norvegica]|uniref:Uncharacterized protein n=1 Tax=Meganyctiphanes norvegica TaxID=48144 RepID=A0AAV2R626_MEGNR
MSFANTLVIFILYYLQHYEHDENGLCTRLLRFVPKQGMAGNEYSSVKLNQQFYEEHGAPTYYNTHNATEHNSYNRNGTSHGHHNEDVYDEYGSPTYYNTHNATVNHNYNHTSVSHDHHNENSYEEYNSHAYYNTHEMSHMTRSETTYI